MTVCEQLVHMNSVRLGWLSRQSGNAVKRFLVQSFQRGITPRAFKGSPVRWMGYLISHESPHRGSTMRALKQNGMRVKEDVSLQSIFGKWKWGKR
jgi:uncharacterized damage-inducible protein DinB